MTQDDNQIPNLFASPTSPTVHFTSPKDWCPDWSLDEPMVVGEGREGGHSTWVLQCLYTILYAPIASIT